VTAHLNDLTRRPWSRCCSRKCWAPVKN